VIEELTDVEVCFEEKVGIRRGLISENISKLILATQKLKYI
jgi:hypothetical protein